jgi:hypothetical protein
VVALDIDRIDLLLLQPLLCRGYSVIEAEFGQKRTQVLQCIY